MTQLIKRMSAFLLCLMLLMGAFPATALAAPDWPSGVSVQAESGIVIDADTGTVLWGQNIHNQYFPASITKIMTALIVIETCSLDETVTFSHNAVFNVEAGSSNAGINEGDKLSVKDCLYALLLKSANEAANALAEHVAGSTEAFADMMNVKAKELGCTDTHFANPSGLNDPEHYTSTYDMALIARAAFLNPTFEEIDSTTYYKLPPNSINPEGLTIYPGHKMLKKSTPYYYPGIVGGKTGYTTLAGNTLVTCARKNGLKLIAVILKGSTPQYWTDTKNLLDFGFENFVSVRAADHETKFSPVSSDLTFGGLALDKPAALILDPDGRIILPKTAEFSDAEAALSYDISDSDPDHAVAKICYRYNERQIGCTYLETNPALFESASSSQPLAADAGTEESAAETDPAGSDAETAGTETSAAETAGSQDETELPKETEDYREKALRPFEIPSIAWIILGSVAGIILLGALITFLVLRKNREEQEYHFRHEQRLKRLQDSGVSADEFNSLMEQRRSAYTSKRKKGRGNRHLKFK
ncbi:D-alanyl-D-alanine carboxypeptidase family protein [Hungatella hathewayi]|uniref:D-alanyl-D-alanine carboxypeptidase family protein n=2 Tax=Lachnospiraceae TaxID=186803 RepID=UPI00242F2A02|nr:D-alanyl-D-alanine carboxypeptidase family protein [Hungatella hathewayi]MCI6455894.1 D-alanyl-D-alanine carboxypeptidase [Hungatella sp.]